MPTWTSSGTTRVPRVITGTLRNKIDRVWDAFHSGGISNPLEVIEQITYLLFLRRLDDLQTIAEKKARLERWETVKRFAILDYDMSNNKDLVTTSLKVRRSVVAQQFRDLYESLYETDETTA